MTSGHHLILGTLQDYLSGKTIADTHDERYRQKLAKFLVEEKGYDKADIQANIRLSVHADEKKAVVPLDFAVSANGEIVMVIKYGPGSLVSRQRPVIAASRVFTRRKIPIAVATNGEDAQILSGISGKVIAEGLSAIPEKNRLIQFIKEHGLMEEEAARALSGKALEMEERILYAFEIDNACPCDDTVCRIS